ncbi:MAG: helix-turn-helix domain-containing protein [Erysipelotrichaceae bacterium]|nr:helix-turn-helix domain-containing protein [Erysipelotrichaceae bacterium]
MKEAVGNNKTGSFIKEQRMKMGLSQSMLAEKMHVSREAVSKWENGHNLPDASIMLQLAEVLNVTVDDLLVGEKKDNQPVNEALKRKNKLTWILIPLIVLAVMCSFIFRSYYLSSNNSLNIEQEAVYSPESEQEIGRIYYFEYDHKLLKWYEMESVEMEIDGHKVLLFSLKQKPFTANQKSDFEVLSYVKYSQSKPFDAVIYYPGNISRLKTITDYSRLIDIASKKADTIICEYDSRP